MVRARPFCRSKGGVGTTAGAGPCCPACPERSETNRRGCPEPRREYAKGRFQGGGFFMHHACCLARTRRDSIQTARLKLRRQVGPSAVTSGDDLQQRRTDLGAG